MWLVVESTLLLHLITQGDNSTEDRPIYGEKLHNPYANLDSADFAKNFRKTNLHAHQSKEGMPLEVMYNYADGEFENEYAQLGYHMALISDHQYINPLSDASAYEHGINLANYHINSFGVSEVSWFDLPIMLRPRNQMQFFVNHLRDNAKLLSVNHPSRLRMFHTPKHLSTLSGYDLLEMDRRGGNAPWDYALSAGYYPMLSATDDSHYPRSEKINLGSRYTMVALGDDVSENNLIERLKKGESYGVELRGDSPAGVGTEPKINAVRVEDLTLLVESPHKVDSVLFIGQDGVVKSVVRCCTEARYNFDDDDTYIRAELYFPRGVLVWLNPVARESALEPMPKTEVNWLVTIVNTLFWLSATYLVSVFAYMLVRKK